MRALRLSETGRQPELLEIDTPAPVKGEICLKVHACGLNFADLLMIKGTYQDTPQVPFTLGLEIAGEITAIGESVTGFAIGDRVAAYSGRGGLAEYACVTASRAVKIPDGLPYEDAAGFPVAYGTSHVALDHLARLQAGETLLVTGAAGGVGLTAVELGKLMGARVIAHARGADKLAIAQAAGADHLIDAGDDLRSAVLDLGGADVVYDAVGGDVFAQAMRATRPGGRLLPIGFASGDVPRIKANHLLVKNLTVIGFYIGGYLNHFPHVIAQSMAQLFAWHGEGRLSPHVSHVLPLSETTTGLELLRRREATGKVVICPQQN